VGIESEVHAAALFVALTREGELELAVEFARWWLDHGGGDIQTRAASRSFGLGHRGLEFDADELGIDEDDLLD
jgi:hypothetical protein